jgi:regulator of replication initiation timing
LQQQPLEAGAEMTQETVEIFVQERQPRRAQSADDLIQENTRLRLEARRLRIENKALALENERITLRLEEIDDKFQNSEEYWTMILR